jgi:hypothetical protein
MNSNIETLELKDKNNDVNINNINNTYDENYENDEDYSDMPPLIDEDDYEQNQSIKDKKTIDEETNNDNINDNNNNDTDIEDNDNDNDNEDETDDVNDKKDTFYYVLSEDGLNVSCSESENTINEYLDVFIRRDVLKYSHMGNVYVSKVKNVTRVTLLSRNLLFWSTERLLHAYRIDKLKKLN